VAWLVLLVVSVDLVVNYDLPSTSGITVVHIVKDKQEVARACHQGKAIHSLTTKADLHLGLRRISTQHYENKPNCDVP
jgi:hypothetical protein